MTDKRPTKAHYSTGRYQHASVYNGDTFGVRLGDLRKLIAVTKGIPDEAEVEFADVSRDVLRVDRYHAKRIVVEHDGNPDEGQTLDEVPADG